MGKGVNVLELGENGFFEGSLVRGWLEGWFFGVWVLVFLFVFLFLALRG